MNPETRKQQAQLQDVTIIGGGVTGTALLYQLAKHTATKYITLIEKYPDISPLNSNRRANSQTLHFGDIETNMKPEKAAQVNTGAHLILDYIKQQPPYIQTELTTQYHKLVLAVGPAEIKALEQRYHDIKHIYPDLELIDAKRIQELEPHVVTEKRLTGKEPIKALYSPHGYAVDFGALARQLASDALNTPNKKISLKLNTKVISIQKHTSGFTVTTNNETITTKAVVVSAGAHSLLFAHAMGYGQDYATLPIQGSFYHADQLLNGKVYTVQNDKLPFAAVHGDPDLDNPETTRFGPTALATPLLEKGNWKTLPEFIKSLSLDGKVIKTLVKIMRDPILRNFILRNFLYKLPVLGKRLFTREAQKIIPTIKPSNLSYNKHLGGIRPQVLDKKTLSFLMGEARINTGDGIIFNMTPSPGASTCLANAQKDAYEITQYLNQQTLSTQLSK